MFSPFPRRGQVFYSEVCTEVEAGLARWLTRSLVLDMDSCVPWQQVA